MAPFSDTARLWGDKYITVDRVGAGASVREAAVPGIRCSHEH